MDVHDNVGVQIGDGNQLHIHAVDNDVGLLVRHGTEQIAHGRENRFYLEISNRTTSSKSLELMVEGLRDTVAKIVPDKIVDLPGREKVERMLVLRCAPTEPMAGPIPFRVVVIDRDTARVRVQSDQVRITIPAKPALASALILEDRVSSGGSYAASLRLMNNGNTELHGGLCIDSPLGGAAGVLPRKGIRLEADRFDLNPGKHAEIAVELDFPVQDWMNRTWAIPIGIEVADHEAVSGPISGGSVIVQYGILSDFRRAIANLTRWFLDWNSHRHRVRRGWLLGCGLLLLFGGFLMGLAVAPSSTDPAAPPPTARPGPAAGAPSSVSATAVPHTMMPCRADTSIAMLKPLTADDARDHGAWLLEMENKRLQSWAKTNPVLGTYVVRASTRDEVCPGALKEYKPDVKYRIFIWVGPVPNTEKVTLCENLNRPADKDNYDCQLLPAVG
jgi:hypothetical protein